MTTKLIGGDLDAPKAAGSAAFGSGPNTAVSRCDPPDNVDVVADAVPLETVTGIPRSVAPSLNCTLPAATDGVTDAVNVTGLSRSARKNGEMTSR